MSTGWEAMTGFSPVLPPPVWDESLLLSGPESCHLGQGSVGENAPQDPSCLRPKLSPLCGSGLSCQVKERLAGRMY